MTYTPLRLGACSFSPWRGNGTDLERMSSARSAFTAFCSEANGFMLVNVRLQARAARGASLCKPLFGGSRTLTAFSGMAANGQQRSFADLLLDYLVNTCKKVTGDFEPERLGGLEVDHQI